METRECNYCAGTGLPQYPDSKHGCQACGGKGFFKLKKLQAFEGICPRCKEHTEAHESCCGKGAYVEGALVSEEEARERLGLND